MNYTIEIIQERIDKLNEAYFRYVENGEVEKSDPVAIINRNNVKEMKEAITILKNCL